MPNSVYVTELSCFINLIFRGGVVWCQKTSPGLHDMLIIYSAAVEVPARFSRNRWCGQDANMIGSTKVGTINSKFCSVSFEATIQLKGGPQLWVRDDPLKRNFDDHPSQKRIEAYETSWVWTGQAATLNVLAL